MWNLDSLSPPKVGWKKSRFLPISQISLIGGILWAQKESGSKKHDGKCFVCISQSIFPLNNFCQASRTWEMILKQQEYISHNKPGTSIKRKVNAHTKYSLFRHFRLESNLCEQMWVRLTKVYTTPSAKIIAILYSYSHTATHVGYTS